MAVVVCRDNEKHSVTLLIMYLLLSTPEHESLGSEDSENILINMICLRHVQGYFVSRCFIIYLFMISLWEILK